MKNIIDYVKKSKLTFKILMVLFCFFVVIFTVSYVCGTESKTALSDIPATPLIYSPYEYSHTLKKHLLSTGQRVLFSNEVCLKFFGYMVISLISATGATCNLKSPAKLSPHSETPYSKRRHRLSP